MAKTAAALIIGNEILTGKIAEANVAYLGKQLFALGVSLQRAVICRDDVETIADELNALRARHDFVFTSGGVGPTHDDVTLDAVAQAFGVGLTRNADMEAMLRAHKRGDVNEAYLRMADVPEGARLVSNGDMPWPTICIDNVYVFPGVPEIFRMKFPVVRPELETGTRFHSRAVYTTFHESEIADPLGALAERFGDLLLGSYPVFGDQDYRTKLTFDGAEAGRVDEAVEAFLAGAASDRIVRVE